ncbi:MAG: DNA polymerase III subunit epsilon [Alphaproteobacteria bacterium]|nr:MAG: DNA polymerase III subunit epsilon [Alphaproteobacteria bacterium]
MEKRKLILDTETTGLNFSDDRVIEIGIVELIDNVLTQNYFHEYINPEMNISLSAQKVHGISNEFLIEKPTFNEIAKKFLDFIKDDIIIIHNAEFDTNFINKELQNCGFSNIKNSVIDTIKIAKKEFPGQTVNLDSLCRKLNVKNTRQNFHGALLDATLLSKVYLNLTTGKQEKFNLTDSKVVNFNSNIETKNLKVSLSVPREKLMNLSDHEKKQHENFIAEMTDPLWKKIK